MTEFNEEDWADSMEEIWKRFIPHMKKTAPAPAEDHPHYRVEWSPKDGEYIATVAGQPSVSWLARDPVLALYGLVFLIQSTPEDVLKDLP